jgi:hypothetical protein
VNAESFYILVGGKEIKGPYTKIDMRDMLATGQVTPETLFAYDGALEWLPLERLVTSVAPPILTATPPPLPAAIDPDLDWISEKLLLLLKDWIESGGDSETGQPDGFGPDAYEVAAENLEESLFREPWYQRYKELCPNYSFLCTAMDALAAKYPHRFKSITLSKGWQRPEKGWIFRFDGSLYDVPSVQEPSVPLLELLQLFAGFDDTIETVHDESDPWYGSAIATFAAGRFFEVLYLNEKTRRKASTIRPIDFDVAMEKLAATKSDRIRLHYITKRGTKVWAYRCAE